MGHWRTSLLALLALVWVMACRPASTTGDGPVPPADVPLGARLSPRLEPDDPGAPIRLRTQRGLGLPLQTVEVQGVVSDPLAFTQLRLRFRNPEIQTLDATLEVELPPAAQVVRFSVQDGDRWREAEVVERPPPEAGVDLRRASPSVLDQPEHPGRFVARIPAIPGEATQEIVLAYVELFEGGASPYRVRLEGLGAVSRLQARVLRTHTDEDLQAGRARGTREVLRDDQQNVVPRDLLLPAPADSRVGVRSGRMVVARVDPVHHDHPEAVSGLTVLYDTSASRARGFDAGVDRLGRVLAALEARLGGDVRLRLIAFDQTYDTVFEGRLAEFEPEHLDRLRRRRALGASNLGGALHYAGLRGGGEFERVLLVSDGLPTAGVEDRTRLLRAVARLRDAGVQRLDVMVDEGARDEVLLEQVVTALPSPGLILSADVEPEHVARRMLRTVNAVDIQVPRARWQYPESVAGLQHGDGVLVFAELDEPGDLLHLELSDDRHDRPWIRSVPLTEVDRPLVEHAFAHGQVRSLVAALERATGQPLEYRRRAWSRVVELCREHRVLNPMTRLRVPGPQAAGDGSAAFEPPISGALLVAGEAGVERRAAPAGGEELASPRPFPTLPRVELDPDRLLLLAADDPRPPEPMGASELASVDPSELPGPSGAGAGAGPDLAVDAVGETPEELIDELRHDVVRQMERGRARGAATPGWAPYVRRTRPIADVTGRGPIRKPEDAYEGNMLAVMNLLAWGRVAEARDVAEAWHEAEPESLVALVALGEAHEAGKDEARAARAYGSLIDLYPRRSDVRRFAGGRLEGLGPGAERLALEAFAWSRRDRPDHPSAERMYAYALLRSGRHEQAFESLANALGRGFDRERFGAVEKLLREDLGLMGAAWIRAEPERERHIRRRVGQVGAVLETQPSLRFVLNWETTGNDVDLHVRDRLGNHAYYDHPALGTGGLLYSDVKQGYGPEVLAIDGTPAGYPYAFQVHYYAVGPLGLGMGKLQIVEHDGAGRLAFDERPFVVLKERAYVDLGTLEGSLFAARDGE